jgi:hypothetical protein
MPDRRPTEQRPGLSTVSFAITDHNKLSFQLTRQLVPLLGRENVPPEIRLYIGFMIILVVALSSGLIILIANLAARMGGITDIHFEYYLIYVCFLLMSLLLVLILTSSPARRFENTVNLERDMETVARARASRKREIVARGRT